MAHERRPIDRLRLLRLGFMALGVLIIGQLFRIQIISNGFYTALANGQHDIFRRLFPERGRIYARDLKGGSEAPMAINRALTLVYAEPERVDDPKRSARLLAPILGLDETELVARLSDRDAAWKPLKRQVDDATRAVVAGLEIPGIGFSDEVSRFYPEATSGAQVLGFLGVAEDGTRVGRYGAEGWFDRELSGVQGFLESEKDSFGRLIAVGRHEVRPARNGDDVVLTIDRTIEYVACRNLEAWVERFGAARGSVVILDPSTGMVLAMCTAPAFDPNAYNKVEDIGVYNNAAIFDDYEPGSVFKTITMAAGLDTEAIKPSTTFTDTGEVKFGPYTIRNSDLKAHGVVDMTEVLSESLNTGMVDIVGRLGEGVFRNYVRAFGFGERTGIQLQTEVAGDISPLDKKGQIWSATASFGQGITVTPLQLAVAYGAIANKGQLMRPTIVSEIRRSDGTVEKVHPVTVRRVLSERAAQLVKDMLVQVVEKGHGKKAGVKGYWIAGKTGTAQIAKKGGGGYEQGTNIGSFVGFGPADDPKFVMIVRIDRPEGVEFAESSAAPLFGDIAKFLLDYFEVPPTRQ